MTVKQILFREITIYAAKYKDILVNFQLISYAFFAKLLSHFKARLFA